MLIVRWMGLVALGVATLGQFSWSHDQVFSGPPPRGIADLERINDRLLRLAPYVIERTVAVQQGESFGSGVIVNPNGRVLTAAHVIVKNGTTIQVTTFDGKKLAATRRWIDEAADTAMLQITSNQHWPAAKLARSTKMRPGAWCIATGHPFTPGDTNAPVLRAGRVLGRVEDMLSTDAVLTHGDSGGPLFNMSGRLIGIHSRIGPRVADSIHIPIELFVERSKQAKSNLARSVLPSQPHAGSTSRFYHGSPIEIGRNHEQVRAAFGDLIAAANQSTVQIYKQDRLVALGTVVDRNGHVLTKWSEIPDSPRCRLGRGRPVHAKLMAREQEYDVALLEVSFSENVSPIVWANSATRPATGSLLATPLGNTAYPYAIGILSRAERRIPESNEFSAPVSRKLSSTISSQRFGFPLVFEHDSMVPNYLCGGPLVDVHGQVVGINIARANRTTTYAIPARVAEQLVQRLLSQDNKP